MSGNVWEWVYDWKGNYQGGSETDPVGPSSASGRVNRGGGCSNSAGFCRAASRGEEKPGGRNTVLGFRLCRSM